MALSFFGAYSVQAAEQAEKDVLREKEVLKSAWQVFFNSDLGRYHPIAVIHLFLDLSTF